MDNQKTFQFIGTPGGFFVMTLVTAIAAYIPIVGWPFAFNYGNTWMADNILINGRKIKYEAGYGEALKFILIGIILICITLGIYIFWFGPKSYRFVADHTRFADEAPAAPAAAPAAPVAPITPDAGATPPAAPTPPVVQ